MNTPTKCSRLLGKVNREECEAQYIQNRIRAVELGFKDQLLRYKMRVKIAMDNEELKNVQADVVSRDNGIASRYKIGSFGLDFWDNDYVPESPQRILERVNLADKLIAEAETEGANINDPEILRSLAEKIHLLMGQSIPRSQAVLTALFVSLKVVAIYFIASSIWGLVFGLWLWFALIGSIIGILISLTAFGAISKQTTRERVKEMVVGVSLSVGNLAILIGAIGLIALLVKAVYLSLT
jgi:hypothetical protein